MRLVCRTTIWFRIPLTYPNWSKWLLVIFNFWKETSCFSQTDPLAGLSGWTYNLPGSAGSALPVTTHSESWNLYLLSPTGTMSITMIYLESGSRPDTLILMTGNILLWVCVCVCVCVCTCVYVCVHVCVMCVWACTNVCVWMWVLMYNIALQYVSTCSTKNRFSVYKLRHSLCRPDMRIGMTSCHFQAFPPSLCQCRTKSRGSISQVMSHAGVMHAWLTIGTIQTLAEIVTYADRLVASHSEGTQQ